MSSPPALTRRALVMAGCALLPPLQACGQDRSEGAAPALSCAEVLGAIGVNTHLGYVDSQYGSPDAVLRALDFIGLKAVRDVAPRRGGPGERSYEVLAKAGVGFCLFMGARRPMSDILSDVGRLESAYPGSVHALEGPNEIKPAFDWNGRTGNAAGRAFMEALRRAAGDDPTLGQKPLVNFTSYAPAAADCDFANQHPYPKAGRQPAAIIQNARDSYVGPAGVMPGKAMVFTEFGYHTVVGPPRRQGEWQGVDEAHQAILIVNGLLDAIVAGVSRTYIYQLLDGAHDGPGGPDQERHFGLFRLDGSPKPAATALRTLFTHLADEGGPRRALTPLRGVPPVDRQDGVRRLRLRNGRGRDVVVLWNEAPVWDSQAAAPASPAPVLVALRDEPLEIVDLIDGSRRSPKDGRVEVGARPLLVR